MADATPAKEAKTAAKDAEPKDDEYSYPVDDLIADSGVILGEESYVVAGALSAVSKKSLTKTEAEAAVKKWLKAEVV